MHAVVASPVYVRVRLSPNGLSSHVSFHSRRCYNLKTTSGESIRMPAETMTILIAEESHARPFMITRYQRAGNRSDVAPKVKSVSSVRLNLNNVRTKDVNTHTLRDSVCTVHERCMGHLLSSSKSEVLLPKWCISDDPEMMDRRSRATIQAMSGTILPFSYARELRSTLMGKRGLMRHKLLGSKPTTSMRGVATCMWGTDPHVVMIPSRWMHHMKVPYRERGDNNTLSPSFSFRPARNGDWAVLLRCPIVSDMSVQPVKIMGWDQLSIGVHPEMCRPLNLDYDGDEVHVIVVSSAEARNELATSRETSALSKFSDESVANALRDTCALPRDNHGDFMVGTTVSMSDAKDFSYDSSLAGLSKCKESSRRMLVDMLETNVSGLGKETAEQWSRATLRMAISNLSVSMGHTFSRQLSIAAMTVDTDDAQPTPYWACTIGRQLHHLPTTEDIHTRAYGYPGVRLATRLAGAMTQSYLDIAKGTGSSINDALLTSLVSESAEYCHLLRLPEGRLRMVTSSRTDGADSVTHGGEMLASTDPKFVLERVHSRDASRSCITMLTLACRKLGVFYTDQEVVHLASLILHSILSTGKSEITSTSPTVFLSTTSCDRLTSALCESLYALDAAGLTKDSRSSLADSNYHRPYCALSLGNMEGLIHLSVSHPR